MELTVDSDFDVAPHVHDDQVNAFFVLDGEVEFAVADDYSRAGRGAWLCAPPGATARAPRNGCDRSHGPVRPSTPAWRVTRGRSDQLAR